MELHEHYREHGLLIGGRWNPASADNGQVSVNPATEAPLGHTPLATKEQVTQAVAAAVIGSRAMRKLTPWERSALLRRAAVPIPELAPPPGRSVTPETAQPLPQ